jgi:chromosome segregation ATPase
VDIQPGSLLLIGLTLVLSLGNLALLALRSRVKREELDTRTRALVVDLASQAPELRAQLSEALARQAQHEADAELARQQVEELRAAMAVMDEAIQTLRQDMAGCHSRSEQLEVHNGELEREISGLKTRLENLAQQGDNHS